MDDRINFKIDMALKELWKKAAESLGTNLTDLIIETVNKRLSLCTGNNSDQEVLRVHQSEMQRKRIKLLRKANKGHAFSVHRFIQTLDKMLDDDYMDESFCINELKLMLAEINLSRDPPSLLKQFYPYFVKRNWDMGLNIIKDELKRQNVDPNKIKMIEGFNKESIAFKQRIEKLRKHTFNKD